MGEYVESHYHITTRRNPPSISLLGGFLVSVSTADYIIYIYFQNTSRRVYFISEVGRVDRLMDLGGAKC
jgi:hypothetical protein